MEKNLKIILALVVLLILSGCADDVSLSEAEFMTKVGFWYGFWHGAILLYSWIISLFDSKVAIFAIYNNGGWYNFGYIVGIYSTIRTVESLVYALTALVIELHRFLKH